MPLVGWFFEAVLMRFDEGELLFLSFFPPPLKKLTTPSYRENLIGNSVIGAHQMPNNT